MEWCGGGVVVFEFVTVVVSVVGIIGISGVGLGYHQLLDVVGCTPTNSLSGWVNTSLVW